MKKNTLTIGLGLALFLGAVSAQAKVENGAAAPDFELPDSKGITHTLSENRGKYIVLEWTNHECPYVKKHYQNGDMQGLQKEFTEKGVVWYSILSSAEGSQGYCTPEEAEALIQSQKEANTAKLLDPAGKVGKLFGAKTTPHMFIIDPEGIVVYQGAIDSIRSASAADVPQAENYVAKALNALMAGEPVVDAKTRPYGCGVKYARN